MPINVPIMNLLQYKIYNLGLSVHKYVRITNDKYLPVNHRIMALIRITAQMK